MAECPKCALPFVDEEHSRLHSELVCLRRQCAQAKERISELEAALATQGEAYVALGELLEARIKELEAEIASRDYLADIRQERTAEATQLWQRETGHLDTSPDLGELVKWLLDERAEAVAWRAKWEGVVEAAQRAQVGHKDYIFSANPPACGCDTCKAVRQAEETP